MTEETYGELKACPFCNAAPKVSFIGNEHTKTRKIIIKCPKCFIQRTTGAMKFDFEWLQRTAYEAWNKRLDSRVTLLEDSLECIEDLMNHKQALSSLDDSVIELCQVRND